MAGPEERLMVGGCDLLLMGTVPGYVPDGERVAYGAKSHHPERIAVGVPDNDLEALEALIADPTLADGLEPDALDLHFLEIAALWGATQLVPSPDLHAAHATGLPLEGIDLSDDEHTRIYTEGVKVRHLVRRTAVRKRLLKTTANDVQDPYDLARQWDQELCRIAPLEALERQREQHMADAVRALTKKTDRLFAVVHAARFDGVFTHLTNGP